MTDAPTSITHWLDGKRRDGAGTRTAPVFNPDTGEVTGSVQLATAAGVGTVVLPHARDLPSRKLWIAFAVIHFVEAPVLREGQRHLVAIAADDDWNVRRHFRCDRVERPGPEIGSQHRSDGHAHAENGIGHSMFLLRKGFQ